MSRKFADDVELPNRDPSAGNYAARKTYVDTRSSDAGNLTTGTFAKQRLPAVWSTLRTISPVSGFVDIDADVYGNTLKLSLSSNATLNVPSNGAEDQVLQIVIRASAAVNLTFHASYGRLSPIPATLAIASGKVGRVALRRVVADGGGTVRWIVEAAAAEQ